jgi:hypothetical protein
MNKDQEDNFRMYQTVYRVLDDNNAIWNLNVPFTDAVNRLNTYINDLNSLREQQMIDVRGITEDKKAIRKKLEALSFSIETIIVFYASMTNNKKLLKKVDFNRSDYTLAPGADLVGICEQILLAANDNALALLPYGLTAAMINSLRATIDSFVDYLDKPTSARSEAAQATKKIPAKLRRTTKLLDEQIDSGMELFHQLNKDFYTKYFKARKIVNTARRKRALKATFLSAANNKAIAGLKLNVDGKIKRTTSLKGTVYVQHLDEGAHFVEAIKADGSKTKIDFNVIKGETAKLEVRI